MQIPISGLQNVATKIFPKLLNSHQKKTPTYPKDTKPNSTVKNWNKDWNMH